MSFAYTILACCKLVVLHHVLCCNAFLVLSSLVSISTEKVRNSATMLAYVVLPKDQAVEADGLV